jgi:2-haloacid dehalogenase
VTFDPVVTAQQVGSYKPNHRSFEVMFDGLGLPRDQILHVAQSLFHDHVPAKELGLSTVWVDRRQGRAGSGATKRAEAAPDLVVPDLATLAEVAGV